MTNDNHLIYIYYIYQVIFIHNDQRQTNLLPL